MRRSVLPPDAPPARGASADRQADDAAGATCPADDGTRLRPMHPADIPAVHAVEAAAYAFPWTRGNFVDSIAAGYPALVLEDADGALLGYLVAMVGVDEMHLLNVTVAPPWQGRGHGRQLMEALFALCAEQRVARLWLEVRASNERARAIYSRLGFEASGRRKAYYPASFGRREDAVVMSLALGRARSEAEL